MFLAGRSAGKPNRDLVGMKGGNRAFTLVELSRLKQRRGKKEGNRALVTCGRKIKDSNMCDWGIRGEETLGRGSGFYSGA